MLSTQFATGILQSKLIQLSQIKEKFFPGESHTSMRRAMNKDAGICRQVAHLSGVVQGWNSAMSSS